MAVYAPHYLLQMFGTIGTPAKEIWSCGIRMFSESFSGFDEEGWFNGVGQSAPAAWFARATSHIASVAALTGVKFNAINAAGHYADSGNTREFTYATPVAGGGGTLVMPYQASLVITWLTDARARGRASKGRIYSPCPVGSYAAGTGLFLSSVAVDVAGSAATLLNTLDAGFGTGQTIRPHIMSGVDGTYSEINTVAVDTRPDTQRRRGNSLVGAVSTVEVTY